MVKFKIGHLKLFFILVGCVIGSGFITGKELIRFFGVSGFIPSVYIACILLFFIAYLLMDAGRRYGNLSAVNKMVFKKHAKVVEVFTLCSLAVIASGMLGGLDSLFNQTFLLPSNLFIFSVVCIFAAKLAAGKGLDAVAKISIVSVPLTLIFVLSLILHKNSFSYTYSEPKSAFDTLILAALYPCMNMFLAAPVLIDSGAKYKYGLKTSAAMSAVCLFFCIILILSAISSEGASALLADMPLLYVTGVGGVLGKVFAALIFLAMFSSLTSCFYPITEALSKTKKPKLNGGFFLIAVFLLSRMGLSGIVKYFYPILGAAGVIYFLALARFAAADRGVKLFLKARRVFSRNE